jgi:hypothetical protein
MVWERALVWLNSFLQKRKKGEMRETSPLVIGSSPIGGATTNANTENPARVKSLLYSSASIR